MLLYMYVAATCIYMCALLYVDDEMRTMLVNATSPGATVSRVYISNLLL